MNSQVLNVVQSTMQSNDEYSVKAELFELVDAEKTRKWKSNFSVERKSGVRDGSMEAVLRTLFTLRK